MSSYIQLLRRLDAEEAESEAAARSDASATAVRQEAHGGADAAPKVVPFVPVRMEEEISFVADETSRSPGLDSLLDRLRGLLPARQPRRVVFSAASGEEAVTVFLQNLAARAVARGMTAVHLSVKQADGRTVLTAPNGEARSLSISPDAEEMPELAPLLGASAAELPLVIIEAPPLGSSGDAALIARACEGLVIVAQPGRTDRAALRAAAERARESGCRTLGIVMNDAPERIPAWLRRLIST
jgi:Mrp family chromosome partitioning ATPase